MDQYQLSPATQNYIIILSLVQGPKETPQISYFICDAWKIGASVRANGRDHDYIWSEYTWRRT